MSEDSILGIPNPLELKNPLETDSQVSTGLAANRSRRQVPKTREHFSYEEENSEIVDDVDWEPPTQKKKVTYEKKTASVERAATAEQLETATSSQDHDPLSCQAETANEEPVQPESTGPLYKDVRRKPQGTDDISETDDLIYCFDCLRDYGGECPVHGPLNIVKDTPIPASVKDEFRARKTTPPVVSVAYSKIPGAKTGVWACKAIPKRTRFGPYEGKMVSPEEATSYSWMVRKNGEPHHCIDASEPGLSNWMRFINSARHKGERNLQAFQYQGSIFFQTSRNISPHEELLVWFGEENSPPQEAQSNTEKKTEFKEAVFKCPACPYAYASPLYLARHTKYCRHLNAPKAKKPSSDSTTATTGPSTIDTSSSTVKVYPKEGNRNKSNTNSNMNRVVTPSNSGPKAREKVTAQPLKAQTDGSSEDTNSRLYIALNPFQCAQCDERFPNIRVLKAHMASHEGASYACAECDLAFFSQETLRRHMDTHPVHPFQCSECGERFSHEETLSSHMMTHAGENPLVCCVCSERFFDKETLTSHLRIHTGNDSHVCNQCNELFFDKDLYNVHLQTHSEEKPYGCDACPKRFARLDLAERHQATHSAAVYECPDCPNRYSRLDTLQKHMQKHKGDHPYKCDKCDKQYIQKAHLTKHMASHSPPKGETYLCTTCNKRFGGKGALSTHQLIHARAAKCPICQMTFKSKCALGFHVKASHQSNIEDLVVTPELPADLPDIESNYVESNYVLCDGDNAYIGSALPESYEEPEIDLCEANIKREIEVSETKFLPVSENALANEVEEPETDLIPVSVTTYHSEVNLPSQTVIKSEIDLPQTKSPAEVDLSPHTIIKSEIDEPGS